MNLNTDPLTSQTRPPPFKSLPSNAQYLPLDLLDRASIRALVHTWTNTPYPPITSLICNAGLHTGGKPAFTPEGIELDFAANHVGHALLIFLLNKATFSPSDNAVHGYDTSPSIKTDEAVLRPDCRIIQVTSASHDPNERGNPITPHWIDAKTTARAEGLDDPNLRYPTVKLGVALFSHALATRAKGAGKRWTCLLYEPGFVPTTKLQRHQSLIVRLLISYLAPHLVWLLIRFSIAASIAPISGQALAALALGIGPMETANSGSYWQIWKSKPSGEKTYDERLQEDLWEWTVKEFAEEGHELGHL